MVFLLVLIGAFLYLGSKDALSHFGLKFFWGTDWDPVSLSFGALPAIFGTLVSSLIAVCIATPLSLGVALFLSDLSADLLPRGGEVLARVIGFLVEMLAAIPSVVYGIWGMFALAPWLNESVQPALYSVFGFLPFFAKPFYGVGMLCAGIVLAIMITPTVSSISREVFSAVPRAQREAALALGATKWEMMRLSVLKASRSGVAGAVILGLGRALGETMAVTMVIGNRVDISASIFAPASTMSSLIANEYGEASDKLHLGALIGLGLALFLITFVINAMARFFVARAATRVDS